MSRLDKKQRHRAKREAKRLNARRKESVSPLKRVAFAPGEPEVWMTDGFGEYERQAQIFIFKQGGGLSAFAGFLVDQGIAGLKDVWTEKPFHHTDLMDLVKRCAQEDIPMNRVTIERARQTIAGAARWAHDNGMRLPKDWVKATILMGGVGDWLTADVSGFTKEFVGHPVDLRQRLVGASFESFIRRSDIRFVFSHTDPYLDQTTGEFVDESDDLLRPEDIEIEAMMSVMPPDRLQGMRDRISVVAKNLANETANWIAVVDQTASTELEEAWQTIVFATIVSDACGRAQDMRGDPVIGSAYIRYVERHIDPARYDSFKDALSQVMKHVELEPELIYQMLMSPQATRAFPDLSLRAV